MFVAVLLAAAAAWLIVTGKTQKRVELGVLLGLWGALVGAYSTLSRHRPPTGVSGDARQELAVRAAAPVPERVEDVEARRRYEQGLEEMLRRQIQSVLSAEIASLRAEVASLRGELVEKVGGQIRLERIETTRLIGSDIEALQQEIEQLKTARPPLDLGSLVPQVAALVTSTADTPPVHTVVEQTILPSQQPPAPPSLPAPVSQPVPVPTSMPAIGGYLPAPDPVADPFASLPRLSRFTDTAPDPVRPSVDPPPMTPLPTRSDAEPTPGMNAGVDASAVAGSGRHSSADEPRTGGRRRRDPGAEDTLARILEREGVDR